MTLVYRTRIDIDNPSHELVPGHAGCRRRREQRFLCRTCGESSLWRRRCWGWARSLPTINQDILIPWIERKSNAEFIVVSGNIDNVEPLDRDRSLT